MAGSDPLQMPDLASHQSLPAGVLVEWWEDLCQLGIGPQVVLLEVPPRWGRTTVLAHLAAAVQTSDAPDHIVPIDGAELAESAGLEAQMLRSKLMAQAQAWYQAADRLSLNSAGTQAAVVLGIGSLFASGMPTEVGFLLAETAAAAGGKIWDDSLAGQDSALARAARAVSSASASFPVLVLIDDADRLDSDLAMTMLQNLVYRSDGQVLAVLALKPDCVLASTLRRNAPLALTGRIHVADANPDMNVLARGGLVSELLPNLPQAAVRRIGQRTLTFADVFAVTSADLLTEIEPDAVHDDVLAAADKAVNSRMERGTPSPEAVALAWAGGVVHVRQSARLLGVLGAAQLQEDDDVSRTGSLIRLADPASPRLAIQVDALSKGLRQAMAAATLDEAVAICADSESGLVDKIIAARAAHRIRTDISGDDRGRLVRVQCDLVTGLEAVGDVGVAHQIAATALAESEPGLNQRQRDTLSAAVLRLTGPAQIAARDPLTEELIGEALAHGTAISLEARVWAAINLLKDPGRRASALSLTDEVTAELSQLPGLGAAETAWRLLLAFHAGKAGYTSHNRALLGPLLNSEDIAAKRAARILLTSIQGRQADVSLQIAILEPQLQIPDLDHDDKLRLHAALARAYYRLGQYRPALNSAREEMTLRADVQGPDHPDTLVARQLLASYTGWAGDPAGARDQFAALLPVMERVLGPDHCDTLASLSELARYTGEAGDAARARDQFAALLPIMERVLGPEASNTLVARGGYATYTGQAGDPAGARDQFAALLPVMERVLGPEHINTLVARGLLATNAGRAGDAAGARDEFAALLPVEARVLGPEHPTTLTALHQLASYTGETGDAAGARELFAALLQVRMRVLGPEHPTTLATWHQLATYTGGTADAAGARELFAALLRVEERVLGLEHPSTVNTRRHFQYWSWRAGQD